MGEGLELWLNRYEASLVLGLLRHKAEQNIKDGLDKLLYKELSERLSEIITEFDAEQARKDESTV